MPLGLPDGHLQWDTKRYARYDDDDLNTFLSNALKEETWIVGPQDEVDDIEHSDSD